MQRTGPIKKKTIHHIHHIQYQSFCFAFEIFHRVLQSLVKARNLATFCQNTTLNNDVMRDSWLLHNDNELSWPSWIE